MFLSASFSASPLLLIVVAFSFLSVCSSIDTKFLRNIFGSWLSESESESKSESEDEYSNEVTFHSTTQPPLSLEERKEQMERIVDMIDSDEDNFVTQYELKVWIKNKRNAYKQGNIDEQWRVFTSTNQLTWDEYKKITYDNMDDVDVEEKVHVLRMLLWDRRRWQALETDAGVALSQEQFAFFLYPEDATLMHALLEVEEMEETDLDRDGRISLEEYLKGTFLAQDINEEPEWIEHKRKHFAEHLDEDSDGYMDAGKVYDWIISSFDMPEVEAEYLIFKADEDGDNQLTVSEIVNSYDLFMKSHVTELGTAVQMQDF